MLLSDGRRIDDVIRSLAAPPPAPPPGPDEQTLRLASIEALLRDLAGSLTALPAPQVHVEPIDLGDLTRAVQAVTELRPGATAEDIAEALAARLAPQRAESADSAVLVELRKTLERLDFRMKGLGGPAFGSAMSDISSRPERQLGVVASITNPVQTVQVETEQRLDYDSRTDGNPVYVGSADPGTLEAAASWTVLKLSYDASDRLTRKQTQTGIAWTARTSGWGS